MAESAGIQTPVLEVRNVSKTFGATQALRQVSFSVGPGEVFAVLGQNGSGKSTLVKVLSGFHQPDPGAQILVGGTPLPVPLPPGLSREVGMGFVYQDLGLVAGMTVLENLTIGSRSGRLLGFAAPIGWQRERRQTRAILQRYGLSLDPDVRVAQLPMIDRALLAIARAAEDLQAFRARTGKDTSLLVLDEPTVFLSGGELDFLFELIGVVAAAGASVMFISHDLEAVRTVASRFIVLRDGLVAGSGQVAAVTEGQMIDMIVGSARERFEQSAAHSARSAIAAAGATPGPASITPGPAILKEPGPAILEKAAPADAAPAAAAAAAGPAARGELLTVTDLAGGSVRGLSFQVREGEILGLAGVTGSGTDDVPYLLVGGDGAGGSRPAAGTVTVAGRRRRAHELSSARAISDGLALVPANRPRDGAAANLSVAENVLMLVYGRYFQAGTLSRRAMAADTRNRADTFDIRPPRPSARVGELSGGNQQKVVMAKWLEPEPKVLLLHEPTQGVDVGARVEIRALVKGACQGRGMGVVWITTDFAELAEMCDRVLVLADGRVVTELAGETVTKAAIDEAVIRTSGRNQS